MWDGKSRVEVHSCGKGTARPPELSRSPPHVKSVTNTHAGWSAGRGLTALFGLLQERKVNLVSLRDGLDLSTAAGRLMAHVLASVAQYETEIRAERVLAGQAAARAAGKTWGGSTAGVPKTVTREQIDTVRRMNSTGESKSAMMRAPACRGRRFIAC